MAVNNDTAQTGPLYGDGSNTAFPFDFIAASVDEVAVYVDGLRLASGAYSVTLQGDGTGTVNTTTAPAAGAEIYLASDPLFTETVQFDRYGPYFPDQINPPLDRAAIRSIYLRGVAQRALLVPIGETAITFPSAAVRASKFLAFDAAGNPITSTGTGADAGLRTDLAATGGAALVKASDGNTVQANLDAKTRTFEQFLPVDYDYTTDDCSAALLTAAAWSATNSTTVVFSRRYRITTTPTITNDGLHFDFQGAQFEVDIDETHDTNFGTLLNSAKGPVGMLFQSADHIRVLGHARFIGHGTAGLTRIAGMLFDSCDDVQTGEFFFQNMAAGVMAYFNSDGKFGDITANALDGAQTFSSAFDDAGTALVVAGCDNCAFGNVHATNNHKPVLYLSVGTPVSGLSADRTNNVNCSFGHISGTGQVGSLDSMLIGARSAVGCKVAGASGTGFSRAVTLTRYTGDDGWTLDGNDFGDVTATFVASDASVDSGISTDGDLGMAIGTNHFGSVTITGPDHDSSGNQLYSVLLFAGTTIIDSLTINGGYFGIALYNASLSVTRARIGGTGGPVVRYGPGTKLKIKQIDIVTGSVKDAQTGALAYLSSPGSGAIDVDFGTVSYSTNGVGTAPTYVLYDGTNGPESVRISHINGTGGSAPARWGTDEYSVRDGRLLRSAIPTTGSFTQGAFVWNLSASANGILGWQRLTTGTGNVSGTDWSVVRAPQQQTGWTTGTGTASKSTFAAYAGATMSASYTQAEAQATNDAAKAASQRILALEQAMRAAGLLN